MRTREIVRRHPIVVRLERLVNVRVGLEILGRLWRHPPFMRPVVGEVHPCEVLGGLEPRSSRCPCLRNVRVQLEVHPGERIVDPAGSADGIRSHAQRTQDRVVDVAIRSGAGLRVLCRALEKRGPALGQRNNAPTGHRRERLARVGVLLGLVRTPEVERERLERGRLRRGVRPSDSLIRHQGRRSHVRRLHGLHRTAHGGNQRLRVVHSSG